MGRKKSKSRQKRINSIDIQIKFPNDESESTINFVSKPTSRPDKIDFQTDDWLPILPNPEITRNLGNNEKVFPQLPILTRSLEEFKPDYADISLISFHEVASCDDLLFTSTLTPLPSSLELKMFEVDALRMDRCCSFRLDCIVFKDSVPCLGNHLQNEMDKIVNSLHPKTAFSFKRKIHDLSCTVDHSIRTYNSVCRNAAVRIDMLTVQEFLLSEKMTRQQAQIEELDNQIQKLIKLVNRTISGTSDKFEQQCSESDQNDKLTSKESLLTRKVPRQRSQIEELEKKIEKLTELVSEMYHTELEQKNKIIRSLEEEVKIFKADKLKEQNFKLNEGDKAVISVEEAKILKMDGFRKLSSKLVEENKAIQPLTERAILEALKLNTENTTQSQHDSGKEVFSTSCKNVAVERMTEVETEINEFEEILELGKYVSKNLLSIQKAREIRSLKNKTNDLKIAVTDQNISRRGKPEELNPLKIQNALLKEEIHSKNRILDTEFPSLRNDILVKSTRIEELEKSIENVNDNLKRSNSLILSLHEENKALKQNVTQLEIEISDYKISHYLQKTTHLRDKNTEMEVEKINLSENKETEQALHKIKIMSSSYIPTIEENKENFESTSMNQVPLDVLMNCPSNNRKRKLTAANSLQEDIQNLQNVIEIQQLSLLMQSNYVRKLSQEISSIKEQNSSLRDWDQTN